MATLLSAIRSRVRTQLQESSAGFWSEAELGDHVIAGCKDMWGAIADLHQLHNFTVDTTNVSMAAATATLTGTPSDLFRVIRIEPRDLSESASGRETKFVPRDYQSQEFCEARGLPNQDPNNGPIIYYTVSQAGAPVAAPTIHVAPKLSSALNLSLAYIPTLADSAFNDFSSDNNPIPGESDNAIFAYAMAFAIAKEREDNSPDPNWLAIYGTEKQNILVRLTPRQEQEPEYVEGFLESPDW